MKYHEKCENCGHQKTAYTFSLNVSLVKALRALVDYYEKTKAPAMLEKLNLTNSQYTNFAHMAYFDLVQNTPDGWVPTIKGIKFVYGEITVSVPVAMMGRDVLPIEHDAWKTTNKKPRLMHIKQIDIISYKQKIEYQKEKSSVGTLF